MRAMKQPASKFRVWMDATSTLANIDSIVGSISASLTRHRAPARRRETVRYTPAGESWKPLGAPLTSAGARPTLAGAHLS